MGSDLQRLWLNNGLNISIHAPTWGATVLLLDGKIKTRISIHAPTWGATDRAWEKAYH